MHEINRKIYDESKEKGGAYSKLVERLNTSPEQLDVEQMLSLFEDTYGRQENRYFGDLLSEVRTHFCSVLTKALMHGSEYLPQTICSTLLRLHRNYGKDMGTDGEELSGILTVNFDSVLDRAFIEVYGGLDYGLDVVYRNIRHVQCPLLLKLHGSFNWRVIKGAELLRVHGPFSRGLIGGAIAASLDFERMASQRGSAWLRPSVYKRPGLQLGGLWYAAEKMLAEIDVLRIVGCSLRNEDWSLISLIFKSQILHKSGFGIELVLPLKDPEDKSTVRNRLQFLSKVKLVQEMYAEELDEGNVFKSFVLKKYDEVVRKNPDMKGDSTLERLV